MNNVHPSASMSHHCDMDPDKAYLSSNFRKETRHGEYKQDALREGNQECQQGGNNGKEGLKASYYTKANVIMLKLIFLLYVIKMHSGTSCPVKCLAVWALRQYPIFGSIISEPIGCYTHRKFTLQRVYFAFYTSAKRLYCQRAVTLRLGATWALLDAKPAYLRVKTERQEFSPTANFNQHKN